MEDFCFFLLSVLLEKVKMFFFVALVERVIWDKGFCFGTKEGRFSLCGVVRNYLKLEHMSQILL